MAGDKPWEEFSKPASTGEPWEEFGGKTQSRPSSGFRRAVGDTAVAAGAGALTGAQLVANAAGADNRVAEGLGDAADFVRGFESAERRAEREARAAKIQEAEESGSTWEEVKANVGAFTEAPIDTTVEALGTSLPTIGAAALTKGRARGFVGAGAGAVQGAGTVKGSIYDAVEREALAAGASPEEAGRQAAEAQAYSGENTAQIGLGAGLGAVAGTTGVEGAVRRLVGREAGEAAAGGMVRSAAAGAAKEAPLEAAQGGQERLAANLALQNEGYDVDPMTGVVGAGALEGLAGGAAGAGAGAVEGFLSPEPQVGQGDTSAVEPDLPPDGVEPGPVPPVEPDGGPAPVQPPVVPEEYRVERAGAPAQPAEDPASDVGALPPPAGPAAVEDAHRTASTNVPTPSEEMGLSPDAGALSAAAVHAVDSGATADMAQRAALEQAAEEAQKAGRVGRKKESAGQSEASTPTGDPAAQQAELGFEVDRETELRGRLDYLGRQARARGGWNRMLVSERDRAQQELDALTGQRGVSVDGKPSNLQEGLERARANARTRKQQAPDSAAQPMEIPNAGEIEGTAQPAQTPTAGQPAPMPEPAPAAAETTGSAVEAPQAAAGQIEPSISGAGKQPWAMTRSEWESEREAVRPNTAQSRLTGSSASEATSRFQRLEGLLYGVNDEARAEIEAARTEGRKIAPERLDELMEQINTPVRHRRVVEKALADGQPVPAAVVSEYPDLTGSSTDAERIEQAGKQAATSPDNAIPEPTEAQKEAGNYAKGHARLHGLDITIENPRGSTRSGKRPDGSTWSHQMSDHYGYIRRTTGADAEQVDVYVGPEPDAPQVFIVDQLDQQSGEFDEHKVMMGYPDQAAAVTAYSSNFDAGWQVGPVRAMPVDEFKAWLKEGDTRRPAGETVEAVAAEADAVEGEAGQASSARSPARTQEEAEQALSNYFDWLLSRDPNRQNPAPGVHGGNDFNMDAGGAPFTKKGQVMVNGHRHLTFKYKKLWDAAKARAASTRSGGGQAEASVPVMITQDMRQQLAELGYSADDVKQMTPAAAWSAISEERRVEPAAEKKPARASKREAARAGGAEKPDASIQDLGEKIGGARKDVAAKQKPKGRSRRTVDERPAWARRYEVSQIVRESGSLGAASNEGRWVIRDTRRKDRLGQARNAANTTFETKQQAESAIPLIAVGQKHRVVPAGSGKYEIWRTVSDRKRVKVVDQQFDSRDAGLQYMAKHAADIIETNTTFGEGDIPLPPDRERKGPERRKGNVEGQDFVDQFGFRGVEFGNWNNQSDRQSLLNDAYDGLLDLADLLGVPPKALSLNGDLGLAFGARGQGLSSARAHYEPDKVVINLTKEHGAGSLAHEWFHALDHHFGRQDGKAASDWVTGSDRTRTLETRGAKDMASHGFQRRNSGVRPELQAAYEKLLKGMFRKAETYVEDTAKVDRFVGTARQELEHRLSALRADLAEQKDPKYWKRNNKPASDQQLAEFDAIAQRMLEGEPEALSVTLQGTDGANGRRGMRMTNDALESLSKIVKAVRGRAGFRADRSGVLDRLRGAMNSYGDRLKMLDQAESGQEKVRSAPTDFAMNAKELDQGRGENYWTTPHEMAARAFQGYVEDKIAEQGNASRFLNYAPQDAGILTPWGVRFPFPRGQERTAINTLFDEFVGTLKTRETDKGVLLFSKGGDLPPSVDRKLIGDDDVLLGWTLLAQNDEAFQLPVSREKDMQAIVSEQIPDAQVEPMSKELIALSDVNTGWRINLPRGKFADVYQKGRAVWIDVSMLDQGNDGKRIYNAAANYAFNNRKLFIGDPAGLSDVALTRRLENMISSALKFGTTEHLWPHQNQTVGTDDVPGLNWRHGEDAHNLRQMINASYVATAAQFPEIENLRYNPAADRFEDVTDGSEFTERDFQSLAESKLGTGGGDEVREQSGTDGRVGGSITAGRTTLERAVFTHTLLSAKSPEVRREILARLGRERSERLVGLLYSFAGRDAQGADLLSLSAAKQRIAAGGDPEQVRQDTGWHRGVDGKWRFEISDDQADIALPGNTMADIYEHARRVASADGRARVATGDVLDHPELFAAYPALADIPLGQLPADSKARGRISKTALGWRILLRENLSRDQITSTLLHELQHGIQFEEGFATGGSARAFASDLDKTGADTYRRLAGEVEARNTQARQRQTPAERRETAPEVTADTPSSDVLVTFNGRDLAGAPEPQNRTGRAPMTERRLRQAFDLRFPHLSKALRMMLQRGRQGQRGGAVIINSADPLRIAHVYAQKTGTPLSKAVELFADDGRINGFYDPKSGLTFLVGPNLNPITGPAVLLHEMTHGQQRQKLDQQAMSMLKSRGSLRNAGERAFLDRVATRMQDAGDATNSREAVAYIVEQAVVEGRIAGFAAADGRFFDWVDGNLGRHVGSLLRSFIRMVRSWMMRHGVGRLDLTVDDLVGYAMAGMERAARGDVAGTGVQFSRDGNQTATPAFKRWFGDSKVVNESGDPLVVYHGTGEDFSTFSEDFYGEATGVGDLGEGFYFTARADVASDFAGTVTPSVMPVYLNIRNPATNEVMRSDEVQGALEDDMGFAETREVLESLGYDGVIYDHGEQAGKEYVAFRPNQVKSATGNRGTFDPGNPDILFSRAGLREAVSRTTAELNKTFTAPGKLSWWHKSIGTMYNLAERSPAFKPVFQSAQGFIDDVSRYANDAADRAPSWLPKLDTWRDIAKSPVSAEDNAAVAKPIFEGTLMWTRGEDGKPVRVESLAERAATLTATQKADALVAQGKLEPGLVKAWRAQSADKFEKMVGSRYESQILKAGIVWTDEELRSHFDLTDGQAALYHEFRDATNRSLDTMARADMLRLGGDDVKSLRDQVMDARDAREAASILRDHLAMRAQAAPDRATQLMNTAHGILERADRVAELQAEGYAPLSRFGKYTVDVVDQAGQRQYFSLFETKREANQMAEQMREAFPGAQISQGTLSDEAYKLFAGITPETLELFGNALGFDSQGDSARDQAFQEYLRLTKTNRSAMRRLIHRKGISGYSEEVGRVLASFVYSNARQTAAGLHMGDLSEAVNAIPQEQGELKDAAIRLADYIKNPQEEAQAVRGLLFAQYLGGSVASAFVNMTQPAAVSFPWLSQYAGARKAASEIARAAKQMSTRGYEYEEDLVKALHEAEEDGTVSPQEVHQLMAQAQGRGSLRAGDGTRLGNARAAGSNGLTRMSVAWGKLFGAAEQLNRRMTFIAAYRIAKQKGIPEPAAFARRAVKETQFVYSKASKMRWGRGAVGGTLMTFKTYSVAYVELMHRLWNQGEPGSTERKEGRKAALLMLGTLMVLSGTGGIPFSEDLDDLIDGLAQIAGYNFSSKQAKREFLENVFGRGIATFIEKGITGLPGMPLDVAGRLGMGDLIPGTGLFLDSNNHTYEVLEIVGPAGDFASRIGSGARKIAGGDIGGGLLEASPVAVRNLAKGVDMASTGMYRDTKGYKVLDTNALEAALKAVGFQPNSVATVQRANWMNQRSKAFYNLRAQEIRATWAQGIFEKDPAKVQEARDAITDWNAKNPDQPMLIRVPDIMRRVREMSKSKDQRIADTAPKAMRQRMREEAARLRNDMGL